MPPKKRKKTLPIQIKATSENFSSVQIVGDYKPIKRFLRFKVPNARFSPAFKARKWDGYISLINRNRLFVGNIEYFCEKALRHGLKVEFTLDGDFLSPAAIHEHFFSKIVYSKKEVFRILSTIPDGYDPRYYQFDSVAAAMNSARAMIYLATGGGKSLILYLVAALLRSNLKAPGLIIVPRISLVEQLEQSTRLFSDNEIIPLTSINHKEAILEVQPNDPTIIISTFQSWMEWADDPNIQLPEIKFLVGDEAHTYSGKGSKGVDGKVKGGVRKYADVFSPIEYRYGLTATPPDEELNKLQLSGLFGPAKYIKKAASLMREGYLAKPNIYRIYIKHKLTAVEQIAFEEEAEKHLTKIADLEAEETRIEVELREDGIIEIQRRLMMDQMTQIDGDKARAKAQLAMVKKDFLLGRDKRYQLITDLAKNFFTHGPMLVLGEKLDRHLVPLKEHFHNEGIRSLYLDRNSNKTERASVIHEMANPQGDTCLSVTYGLFQMGIDIPTLSNVMLFSPSGSPVRVLQSIGRGLRPNSICNVFDMIDYVDKIPENAKTRMKIYNDEYDDQFTLNEMKLTL